jgi:hypothetical protein
VTTPVERCGEWHSRSAVTASRNAGVYSFSGCCLPKGRAIIGFVANEGHQPICVLWIWRPSSKKLSNSWPAIATSKKAPRIKSRPQPNE